MKVIFYFQVLYQTLNLLGSAKGNCTNGYEEPFFLKDVCKDSLWTDFMTSADIMIRSDSTFTDPCSRITNDNQDNNSEVDEVDFIVVGGGVAGPVVAGRLSENYNWSVTLLESGPEQPAAVDIPALMSSAVGTKYDFKYLTEKQKYACLDSNGICQWPRGKLLGGTAVLSGSMYSRGHSAIYDQWNVKGWFYKEIEKYFIKSENNYDYTSKIHGKRGPISVRKPTEILKIAKDIIAAAKELEYPEIDMSDPAQPSGISLAQIMMNSKNLRVSTPTAYLRPVQSRSNLKVKINSHVTKLLINTNDPNKPKVEGVEYLDKANNNKILKAKKEVILSAGVIGSPHILMLSGIGPKEDLKKLNIKTVKNLMVGHNLQHHVASMLTFKLNVTNNRFLSHESLANFIKTRKGPLSTTGCLQTSGFFRSNKTAEMSTRPADIQLFFDGFSLKIDGNQCKNILANQQCNTKSNDFEIIDIRPVNILPKSRGTIKLVSKDPLVRPKIDPKYLSVRSDIDVLIEGIKLAQELMNTKPFEKLGATLVTPKHKRCTPKYKYGTDKYWGCFVKYTTLGENHHAGTCKMGPAEKSDTVVDPTLKVIGVDGVRVVDASVIPLQPNCNPIAPIIMIAEKAADLIKENHVNLKSYY